MNMSACLTVCTCCALGVCASICLHCFVRAFLPASLQVRKRDGAVGYDSTDLAAIRFRLLDEKFDWLIYVVDSGQSLHFDVRCLAKSCSVLVCEGGRDGAPSCSSH